MYTLLLRLAAPLQSWGSGSMYDRRDTDQMPTKSGVIGIVAAALGRKRNEPLDDLSALQFGVRIDKPGELVTDFQITDMGGKLNSNLSYRNYLSDAVFLAGLSGEDGDFLSKIDDALHNPVFALFLGRRSCPPTMPLSLGIKEKGLYDALYEEEWLIPEWMRKRLYGFGDTAFLRIVIEDRMSDVLKKDNPVSFSPFKREYYYRSIAEKPAKIIHYDQSTYITDHDPMSELR